MLSTTIILACFLSLIVLQWMLWVALLRLGLRWASISEVTTRQIVAVTVSVIAVELVLETFFRLITPATWRLLDRVERLANVGTRSTRP